MNLGISERMGRQHSNNALIDNRKLGRCAMKHIRSGQHMKHISTHVSGESGKGEGQRKASVR